MCDAAQEDLYAVLGGSPSDSAQELRQRYQKLALQHHPDRLRGATPSETERGVSRFQQLEAAWRILSDESSRRRYDQQRRARELKQEWPVDASVFLQDMSWDAEERVHTYGCRCGGVFSVTAEEVEEEAASAGSDAGEGKHVVVCCDTCSLSVDVALAHS
ncbi:dnaJ homolog subfamily C member 24 [Neosynchiropus ocellatus]